MLEIHVDEADGSHISAARVEIAYDGKSNVANTDNKGIALFSNIPTGIEITYNISNLGYNTASGTWIIDTDVEMDTTTGMYTANTLTVALTGDTRSSISQITIYVADSMYTLNTVIYNGGVTYYFLEMLNDTTVIDYFDRRNGQTVDVQLIDE